METTHPCPVCAAESPTDDYCGVCGAAMRPSEAAAVVEAAVARTLSGQAVPTPPTAGGQCPNCHTPYAPGDVYCELCGTNFITGEDAPLPPPPREVATEHGDHGETTSAEWFCVIDADRELFEANQAETPQNLTFPEDVAPREVPLTGEEVIIGRRDEASGFFPDIDLSTPTFDPGVSRRHAVLERQPGGPWTVTDANSTNGTWLNGDEAPLPPGKAVVLSDGDRISLGAFSRIVVRRSGERTGT
ncbi:MAG: FHA domain-containing protein [Actinomycetota bacterium]|nr:FHA domain-containing protein [Actinomycetota bacterium]